MESLSRDEIRQAVTKALAEDIGDGDATTLATISEEATARAAVVAREPLVVCGMEFAVTAFAELSAKIQFTDRAADGQSVTGNTTILLVSGPTRAILTAERVALNYLQRLSGVATLTRKFADAVASTKARILDTRKTTPGWRRFEKYAVACGGGLNHRLGLFDLILIKDNHLAALRGAKPNAIQAAVERARALRPDLKVEVEADTLAQVEEAVAAGADVILLDNMSPDQIRAAVAHIRGRAKTEASGGITLANVRAMAETGVDFISVGALTHSARAVDIGLDFLS